MLTSKMFLIPPEIRVCFSSSVIELKIAIKEEIFFYQFVSVIFIYLFFFFREIKIKIYFCFYFTWCTLIEGTLSSPPIM